MTSGVGTFLSGMRSPVISTVGRPPSPGGPAKSVRPLTLAPERRRRVPPAAPKADELALRCWAVASVRPAPGEGPVPVLFPSIETSRGRVVLSGDPKAEPVELFDAVDALRRRFPRLYLIDLDGRRKSLPQLDYLQEISRDVEVWADAGCQRADQAIDTIVAGAQRCILSTDRLERARELRRAWKLSTEIALELVLVDCQVLAREPEWRGRTPGEVATEVAAVGLRELVVSFLEGPVDWRLIGELAGAGFVVYLRSGCSAEDGPRLAQAGAAGGVFPADRLLLQSLSEAA